MTVIVKINDFSLLVFIRVLDDGCASHAAPAADSLHENAFRRIRNLPIDFELIAVTTRPGML